MTSRAVLRPSGLVTGLTWPMTSMSAGTPWVRSNDSLASGLDASVLAESAITTVDVGPTKICGTPAELTKAVACLNARSSATLLPST